MSSSFDDFETVVIRHWAGKWVELQSNIKIDKPKGGYIITFHKGENPAYKAEHYNTIDEIVDKYSYRYAWMQRDISDSPDVIMVGI